MSTNIFAFTESTPAEGYPAFVSINRDDQGRHTITVRSRGNGGRDIATVEVSPQMLESMMTDIAADLYRDEVAPQASAPSVQPLPAMTAANSPWVTLPGNRGRIDLREVESIENRGEYPDECTLRMRSGQRISVGAGFNKTAGESADYWLRRVSEAKAAQPAAEPGAPYPDTRRLDWLLPNCHPATWGMEFPGGYEWDSDAEYLAKWRAAIDAEIQRTAAQPSSNPGAGAQEQQP